MKPFDLEKALAGKPICTLSGYDARILAYDLLGDFPLSVAIREGEKHEISYSFNKKGVRLLDDNNFYDLFMKTEIVTKWLNVYKDCNNFYYTSDKLFFDSFETAFTCKCKGNYIGTFPIQIEE